MQTISPAPQTQATVRQATVADASALRELRLESLQRHPEVFGSDYEREAPRSVADWETRLGSQTTSVVFVAASSAGLVGMTGLYWSELVKQKHNVTVWGVYVRPAWRGQGVARHLLKVCLDWAREHQFKWVKLAVVTTNTAAIHVYQSVGFRVYGVDPAVLLHAGTFYDELLMAREL